MEILSHARAAVTSKTDAIAREQARAYSQFRGSRVDFPLSSPEIQTQIATVPVAMVRIISNGVSNGASKSETISSMAAETYPPFIEPSMDDQSNPLAKMEIAYQKSRNMRKDLVAQGYRGRDALSDSATTSARLETRDDQGPVKSKRQSNFSRVISDAGYRSDPLGARDFDHLEAPQNLSGSSTSHQLTSAHGRRQNIHAIKAGGGRPLSRNDRPHSDIGVLDSHSFSVRQSSISALLDGVDAAIDSICEARTSQEESQPADRDVVNNLNGQGSNEQAVASPNSDRYSNRHSSKLTTGDYTQPRTPYTQRDLSSLLPQSYQLYEIRHNNAPSSAIGADSHSALHPASPLLPSVNMAALSQPNPLGHPAAPASRDSYLAPRSTSKRSSKLDFIQPSKSQPSTPSHAESSNQQSLTSPSKGSPQQKRQHNHSLSAGSGTNEKLGSAAATSMLARGSAHGVKQLPSDLGSPSKKTRLSNPLNDIVETSLIVNLKLPRTTPKKTNSNTILKLKLGQSNQTASESTDSISNVQPTSAIRPSQASKSASRAITITSTTATPPSKPIPAKTSAQTTDLDPAVLTKLNAKPHIIRPPTPETNSHNWSTTPTWLTSQQQKLLSGPSRARLTTLARTRPIHQSERGRWTFETNTWPLPHQVIVREQLEKFVEGNSLGCMTYARIKADLPGDLRADGLGRVEVWCFGEQVDATYLAILIMTKNWMVPGIELKWLDVEDKVVVEVAGR